MAASHGGPPPAMTADHPVDDELRRFVIANIPSVSCLEAALLFRSEAVSRSIDEVARALYISQRERDQCHPRQDPPDRTSVRRRVQD
jgi:hypothetical protein